MKNILLLIILLLSFSECNNPSELPVLEMAKPADEFAKGFINNIVNGQLDSCFTKIDLELINDSIKTFLTNASHDLKGVSIKKYNLVEENFTVGLLGNAGQYTFCRLAYECKTDNSNLLLILNIGKKGGKYIVTSFNGTSLSAPLKILTEFTLKYKSPPQYIFLIITVLVPVFILASLFVMLFSKMTAKKKIAWTFIILLVSLPKFYMNWGTGQFNYNIININLLGAGVGRPNLYSYWTLSFNLPIGAILFWLKRKRLLTKQIPAYTESELLDNTQSEDVFSNSGISIAEGDNDMK